MQPDTIIEVMSKETGIDKNILILVTSETWPMLYKLNAYIPIRLIEIFEDRVMMACTKKQIGWN